MCGIIVFLSFLLYCPDNNKGSWIPEFSADPAITYIQDSRATLTALDSLCMGRWMCCQRLAKPITIAEDLSFALCFYFEISTYLWKNNLWKHRSFYGVHGIHIIQLIFNIGLPISGSTNKPLFGSKRRWRILTAAISMSISRRALYRDSARCR